MCNWKAAPAWNAARSAPAEPSIAFIVLSNNSGPAYRKRYLGEGARQFLDKSSEFDQLVDAVVLESQAD